MGELLPQYPRRSALEGPHNIMRGFFMGCFHKQVDMIGLNRQAKYCPAMFLCNRMADFVQSFGNRINQHFSAALRYPHQVIVHLMHRMISASNFISFHVDSLMSIDRKGKGIVPFHPSAKAQGLPAPDSYKDNHRDHHYKSGGRTQPLPSLVCQ